MARSPNSSPHTQAVLQTLLTTHPRPSYGYDLSKATGLKGGTLYPILQRLHGSGHLGAEWEDSPHPGKPPRHIYTLTEEGLRLARERKGAGPDLPEGSAPVRLEGWRKGMENAASVDDAGWAPEAR